MHESFESRELVTSLSDRKFALQMAAVLASIGLINGLRQGHLWPWLISMASIISLVSWISPATLHPFNTFWTKFGFLLHRIVNPVVMSLLFYGVIWPTGVCMRILGYDLLQLKRKPNVASYWISRTPGPSPETMKDQF